MSFIPSKSYLKWLKLKYSQKQQNSQQRQLWEISWKLLRWLTRLYSLNRQIFPFFPIKILLEMAEIWQKVAKQLATVILGDQLMASQITSQIILFEQTNFLFYPVETRLDMAEIWPKAPKQPRNGEKKGQASLSELPWLAILLLLPISQPFQQLTF